VKLIRYPRRDDTGAVQGVGAHKDAGLITLLLQDDQAGLQVETPQGWVDVPPRAGTFVINIGELLELASDGYLRATMHRVVTPHAGVERTPRRFSWAHDSKPRCRCCNCRRRSPLTRAGPNGIRSTRSSVRSGSIT
jgi:isopenicillin N synthase-like dioxygenase